MVDGELRKAKTKYLTPLIAEGNAAFLWKHLNTTTMSSERKSITELEINGVISTDSTEIVKLI